MKVPTAAVVVLLALLSLTKARPEGMVAMTEAAETPTPNPTSMDTTPSASHEDSSSEEDKNITVLAKTAVLCPPQQPELLAIETECLSTVEPSCLSNQHESSMKSSIEVTTEMAANPSSTDASHTSGEQCKSICKYHQCVLEKLEVLDNSGKPNKTLLSNWIANNITDEKQREQLQHKLSQCPSMLPEGSLSSSDDSKSSEEETVDSKKTTSKPKCCKSAKKVMHCIFDVECPIIKLLEGTVEH